MSTLPDARQATSTPADAEPTLRSVTAPSGYVFPAIWSFPPFFTYVHLLLAEPQLTRCASLQPNPQTFAHQIGLWTQLLLSWAKFHRVFTLDAGAVDGGDCRDVFHNTAINSTFPGCSATRADTCAGRLQPPAIKQFVSHLLKEGECGFVPIDVR
jgi:ESCRT-II complex subunit VPS25